MIKINIVVDFPPNYKEISKAFDLSNEKPIFTYEDTIFNPHGIEIYDYLKVHELVHTSQQWLPGMNAKKWWKEYIEDEKFRLDQEVKAYREQYKYMCETVKDKNGRHKLGHLIASQLSSKMYGNMVRYHDAYKLIKNQ